MKTLKKVVKYIQRQKEDKNVSVFDALNEDDSALVRFYKIEL